MSTHKFFIFLLIINSFLYSPLSRADESKKPLPMSLSKALEMAKQRQSQIIMSNERLHQALARIEQNRSPLLPQLTASVSQTRQTRDLRSAGITLGTSDPLVGPFNSYDARVRLTQTIFDAAALQRLREARQSHQLSLAESRKVEEDTLALVATLFIEARRSSQNLTLAKVLRDRDRKHFDISRTHFKLGTGSLLELKQAKAAYAQSLYNWRKSVKEARERRLDFGVALSIPPEQEIIFESYEQWIRKPMGLEKTFDGFTQSQPDLQLAQQQLKESLAQKNTEKAEYLPKISAVADYGPSGIKPGDANETYALGLQASVPFWEGGLRSARVKEAASRVKEKEENLRDTGRNIEAKVLTALQTIKQAKAFIRQKKSEMDVAQEEIKLAYARRETGAGSEIELTDALAQLAVAKDQKEEAGATYLMAQINLAHLLGEMDFFIQKQQGEISEK